MHFEFLLKIYLPVLMRQQPFMQFKSVQVKPNPTQMSTSLLKNCSHLKLKLKLNDDVVLPQPVTPVDVNKHQNHQDGRAERFEILSNISDVSH